MLDIISVNRQAGLAERKLLPNVGSLPVFVQPATGALCIEAFTGGLLRNNNGVFVCLITFLAVQ